MTSGLPGRLREGVAAWVGRSVANRVALVGATLTAVFVLFAGSASFLVTRAFVMNGARTNLSARASLVAERVQGALRAVETDVGGLARSSLVANGLVDSSGRSAYLRPFLRDHAMPAESVYRLGLADHRGRVVASNDDSAPSYGGRTWWRPLLEDGLPHAEILAVAEPTLLLAYPVVYPGTGQPEGALVLELPLRRVLEWSASELPPEHAVEFRSRGVPIFSALPPRGPAHAPGSGPALLEAREVIEPDLDEADLSLSVVVTTPRHEALRSLVWLGLIHALGGAIALGAASWVAYRSSWWLMRPIIQLSRSAEAIAHGGCTGEVRFEVQGEDEPAQLGRTLQVMLDRLRSAHTGLEARVAERTLRLELAESRLRAILDHMLDGLVTLDEAGRIESFNRAAEQIFGWRADEVVGRDVGLLMPAPHAGAHAGYVQRYLAGGAPRVIGIGRELEGLRRDGRSFPMELQVSELQHQGRRIFVGIVRDITERRKVERMKSEFVSVVSHELRTPLTSIRGALGLVAGGASGAVPEGAGQLLRIAQENSVRLTKLIDDLLDVQRIEAGAMRLSLAPAVLDEMLEQAVVLNQAFAARLQLAIAVQGPLPRVEVAVDASRFQQVMANLLSNACKFSPPGGEVQLAASCRGDRVRIEVRDRGPGIPADFRERIFGKFSQADASASRSGAGTGLGLAISKGLVERMAGTIGFAARDGGGTVFFVELPVLDAKVRRGALPG